MPVAVLAVGCHENKSPAQSSERTMEWNDPLDPVAISLPEIVSGRGEILLVTHDEGHGGWQFLDGQDVSGKKPEVVPKVELLRLDPTIGEIIDLPVGWKATRKSKGRPWVKEPNPEAEPASGAIETEVSGPYAP
jgi:hypothetical protein